MPESLISDLLKQSFPESNKQDWSRAASKEIQGGNPSENLSWLTKDGLTFLPYYDLTDVKNLDYLKNFELSPSPDPYGGARAWQNLPRITVQDIRKSNLVARDHLANGADGIFFDLCQVNVVDINTLLENIDWPFCNITFLTESSSKIFQPIIAHIEKQKYDPALLAGTLFWQQQPRDAIGALRAFTDTIQFRSLGIFISPSSPAKEISDALTKGVKLMDVLTDQGADKGLVWRNLSLSLPAGPDFILEIAKLKALRVLWYQVAQAFEIIDFKPKDINIHVRSVPWISERFQPHSNVLKSTVSALSAVVGGCDSLTIEPEDELNTTMNRVARNVSSIIREEAHLNMVADPVAGAYAIESIIDKLAEAAWKQFQSEIKQS